MTRRRTPTIKAKIHVTQAENDEYFGQKLPTWRNGFCFIERTVTVSDDPIDMYAQGEYGTIRVGGRLVIVAGDPATGMEILGEKKA
jgi:hypothetical protein